LTVQAVEEVGLEALGPVEGGADVVGTVLEPDAVKRVECVGPEMLGPMVGAAVDVGPGLIVDVDATRSVTSLHEAVSSGTGSYSDSSTSTEPELGKEDLAWGKTEEYFRLSLSGEGFAGSEREDSGLVRRVTLDTQFCSDSVGSGLADSACMSYTGPNSVMQMVPRRAHGDPEFVEAIPRVSEDVGSAERELQQERMALRRIKLFCASILKKLAPPLLREVESSSGLRADAQPFTPRCMTRSSAMVGEAKSRKASKASAAETVLLKALGICPEELSVDEEHLASFHEIFDSPLGDRHVRVMASIFGKMVPQSFGQQEGCRVAVAAH
jgi:hypothetical protein